MEPVIPLLAADFLGTKVFAVNIVGKLPALIPLSVTLGLLLAGVLYSLYRTREEARVLEVVGR